MRRRIYYSTEQKREIWDRWKRGESAHEIGRLFDRPHSSIFKILMKTGGLRPPETMKFIAREDVSSRQLSVSLSNFTNQNDESGPAAKRWAAHMHSMCESFSRLASR